MKIWYWSIDDLIDENYSVLCDRYHAAECFNCGVKTKTEGSTFCKECYLHLPLELKQRLMEVRRDLWRYGIQEGETKE